MHHYYAFQGNYYISYTQTILSLLLPVFMCVETVQVRNGSCEGNNNLYPIGMVGTRRKPTSVYH